MNSINPKLFKVCLVIALIAIVYSFFVGIEFGMNKICSNSGGIWVKGDKCVNITGMGYCLGKTGGIYKGISINSSFNFTNLGG